MKDTEYMDKAEQYFVHTYNRFKVVIDKAEGAYIYDVNGKKYLDFASGIGVCSLGYGNEVYKEALKTQIDKITHTSNLFYNIPSIEAAEKIVKAAGLEKVFFTNSGAEAIEGALKMAKRYAYDRDGHANHEVIAMNHSFHGRTMGSLALTGNEHYQKPFGPMIGGIKFAEYNNLDSVKELVNDKTCAIILEPLQGEGGIYPATKEFIEGIRELCTEKDIIMICDEVQCGMGRTGSMFTWQSYGIRPDIMSMAKAIGNGIPVGAFAMTEEIAKYSLEPGDHGTTYGGNPLACTAVSKTIEIFEKKNLVAHVQELGAYLTEKLEELKSECDCVKAVKGKGLMQGIQVTKPLSEITKEALKEGLLIIGAGNDVIRFVPPLIIEKEHVDEMIRILKKVL
jgi:acetylornithine/N-succinyldiaminopimelate aminotransferase